MARKSRRANVVQEKKEELQVFASIITQKQLATSGRGICATIPVIKRHGCLKIFWKMKRRCRELRISRSMTVWMKYFRRGKRIMEVLGCSR